MTKRESIEAKAEVLLAPIVERLGFELVDVEYVKEGSNWYLRGYIDKEGGISINECVDVSRLFNEKLDQEDFIEDSYIMEISSPGLGRPLKKKMTTHAAWVRNLRSVLIVQSTDRKSFTVF